MSVTLFFSYYFLLMTSLILGIYIGTRLQKELLTDDLGRLKKNILPIKKPETGAIRRPTAQQLRDKGTIIEETKGAMSEILQSLGIDPK